MKNVEIRERRIRKQLNTSLGGPSRQESELLPEGLHTSLWPEHHYIWLLCIYTCAMTIKSDFHETLQDPPPRMSAPPPRLPPPGPPPCSNPEVKGQDLDVVVEAEVKLESR